MAETAATLELDATDLRILDQLQRDASLTNQALAAVVHTSPATCLRRVKRLVDAGVIERQVALLSPQRLGAGLTAIGAPLLRVTLLPPDELAAQLRSGGFDWTVCTSRHAVEALGAACASLQTPPAEAVRVILRGVTRWEFAPYEGTKDPEPDLVATEWADDASGKHLALWGSQGVLRAVYASAELQHDDGERGRANLRQRLAKLRALDPGLLDDDVLASAIHAGAQPFPTIN